LSKEEIKFLDTNLIAQYGARPVLFRSDLAKRFVERGVAKYHNRKAIENPLTKVSEEEIEKIKDKYKRFSYITEEKYVSDVCWITGGSIPDEIIKEGNKMGFRITILTSNTFSPGDALQFPLIILSSNLDNFTPLQLSRLKFLLFEKTLPYMVRIESISNIYTGDNTPKFLWHCINRSRTTVFPDKQTKTECLDSCGQTSCKQLYIDNGKPNLFWRKVNKVLKGLK
jgi:hypothetical protein